MRVIAGRAGGVPLLVPRTDLRPTMDQVRAAIFSSLADRVPGARVLDLFAGSGALGIEALSRGAASAVFVECDRRAADCIARNLGKTKLVSPAARVLRQEVFAFLDRSSPGEAFDLIFADPPYAKTPGAEDFAARLLENDALRENLRASGGLFVLEKAPRQPLPAPALAQRWQVLREKRYGGTEVVFLQPLW
ncbi:MAG: 16S rRNA (guanine(966)-N(2))-methyltransferase RsmD [Verrucomicrobia bacterium]|nr:16S rRNA (guanine(966)-N(2))-methyltransferase RsmD [Verrucomicrobiota bacterium]MBV9658816.1 16S rRNA (guanine(966)-N(2))-methyltransferase RsmD [Verrucomicrobiota bacterium]